MTKKVQRKDKTQKFSKGIKEQKSLSLAKKNKKSGPINLENQNYGKSCEIEIIEINESTFEKQASLKNGLESKTKLQSQKDSGQFKEFIKGHIAKNQQKFSKEQINQRLIKIIQKQKYFQKCKQKSQGSGFSPNSKEKIQEGLKQEGTQVKLENRSLKQVNSREQIEAEEQQSSLKQGEYSVERIVSSIMKNGQVQYEIKWVGYPEDQNTYEPMNNLKNIASMVANFEQKERLGYQKKCKQKDKQIREKNNQLKQKDKLIEQKEYQIQLKARQIAQRDKQIQEMGSKIRSYQQKIRQMEKQLQSMKRLQKEKQLHTLSSISTKDQTECIIPQIKQTRSIQVQTQTCQDHFQNYSDQITGFFDQYPLEKKIQDSIHDIEYSLPFSIADRILSQHHLDETILQCEQIVEECIQENPSSLVQQFDYIRGSRFKTQQQVNEIFEYTKHQKANVQDIQTSYMDLLEG